ncbi:MAG: AI-2E family transporter, partial [Thiohalomonadales bacterium]
MLDIIKQWYQRNFTDPQAVLLVFILIFGFAIILLLGDMLAPVFAAIVIAYLLESPVQFMKKYGARRRYAVIWIFLLFLTILFFIVFGLMPILLNQITEFLAELPTYVGKGRELLLLLQDKLHFIPAREIETLANLLTSKMAGFGQVVLTKSLASIPGIITALIYLILVPMLVLFFMKDKWRILIWFSKYIPRQRGLASKVWFDLDVQLGKYVKGKFWEFLILGGAIYICFAIFGLKYAILLSALVGISVVMPYIGIMIVSIPVFFVAYFQFGFGTELYVLLIVYFIINAIDGYVLVPVLFSEVVNIHPIAIIISILLFGGLWGLWGVFFAIPLATLINAILTSWPRLESEENLES